MNHIKDNLSEQERIRRHLTTTMFSITNNARENIEEGNEKKKAEYDFLISHFLDMLSQKSKDE